MASCPDPLWKDPPTTYLFVDLYRPIKAQECVEIEERVPAGEMGGMI